MARPKGPRMYRSPLLPTPVYHYPAYNNSNYFCRTRYQNFNDYPNYDVNYHLDSIDPISEIYHSSLNVTSDIPSESIDNVSNFIPEPIDPKLDFCSDSFDPNFFLDQPYEIMKNILPYPKAKEYNNLAEYYSHHFLKKDTTKKAEKDRLYDRDYAWYYKILGWDDNVQKRYEQRILRRPKRYAGWRTAKLRKYKPHFANDDPNYEPCRSFPPLQSAKIIQTQSRFRKYKIFRRSVVIDSKESTIEMSGIPEMNLDKEIPTPITKKVDLVSSSNVTISVTEKNSKTDSVLSSGNTLRPENENHSANFILTNDTQAIHKLKC